jgi:flagellar export protein FliJ
MPRRAFGFEQLLRARRGEEALRAASYASSRVAAIVARQQYDAVAQQREAARAGIAGAHGSALRALQGYLGVLERRAADARDASARAARVAVAAREVVSEAARARAALELLLERRRAVSVRRARVIEECERDDLRLSRPMRDVWG